jgi:hypothetical protein
MNWFDAALNSTDTATYGSACSRRRRAASRTCRHAANAAMMAIRAVTQVPNADQSSGAHAVKSGSHAGSFTARQTISHIVQRLMGPSRRAADGHRYRLSTSAVFGPGVGASTGCRNNYLIIWRLVKNGFGRRRSRPSSSGSWSCGLGADDLGPVRSVCRVGRVRSSPRSRSRTIRSLTRVAFYVEPSTRNNGCCCSAAWAAGQRYLPLARSRTACATRSSRVPRRRHSAAGRPRRRRSRRSPARPAAKIGAATTSTATRPTCSPLTCAGTVAPKQDGNGPRDERLRLSAPREGYSGFV